MELYADAGDPVLVVGGAYVAPFWDGVAALVDGHGAAGMEDAAWGRAERAGDVASEDDALAFGLHGGVWDGDGGEEGFGVGV